MQKLLRWTLAAGLLAAALPLPAHGQTAPAAPAPDSPGAAPRDSVKTALLRQLLQRVRAADQAVAVMEASLPAQRAANPRIPAVFWDRFIVQARDRRGELTDMISVIYERHFTADELRQLLAFYDTPLGQKMLAVQPVIAQESMQAGREWGARIGAAVGAQLDAEGVRASP